MSYKSTALSGANVKSLATGVIRATMQAGDYVIGDVSVTGSDMINFREFFRVNGAVFSLPDICKVSLTNLSVPVLVGTPTPDPIPTTSPFLVTMTDTNTGEIWTGTLAKQ